MRQFSVMQPRLSAARFAGRRSAVAVCLPLVLLAIGPVRAQAPEEEGPPVALGSHVDFVTIDGGERLRGEIKELQRGKLKYKTRATDTIYFTWDLVAALESPRSFEVETIDGEFYFGSFVATDAPGTLRIASESWVEDIPMDRVATIKQLKESLWARLDGSLSLGLSIVTASNLNQFTGHADVAQIRRRTRSKASFDHISNRGDPENPVSRQDLIGSWERSLQNRWGVLASTTLQSNEELGLDFRALISTIGIHRFIQSSHRLLGLGGGVAVQREKFSGSDFETNVEGVIQLDYEVFSFVARDLDVTNRLVIYPSFTVSGRVRVDLNMRARRELYKDLFWDLNLNYSYDSDPQSFGDTTDSPDEAQRNDDLSLTMSLAWKF